MLNPYLILGFVLALAVAGGGGFYEGRSTGIDSQKVADQKSIDVTNAQITAQKAEANTKLEKAQADLLASQEAQANVKNQLETEHAQNAKATDDLRNQLAGERLRFAAQVTGGGSGGGDAQGASPNSAGHDGPTVCELSSEASATLGQIVYDADKLRDDYKLLYDWSHSLR